MEKKNLGNGDRAPINGGGGSMERAFNEMVWQYVETH